MKNTDPKAIIVRPRQEYTADLFDPVCNRAKEFCKIAKTKTLTWKVLQHVQSLGFKVLIEHPDVRGMPEGQDGPDVSHGQGRTESE